MLLSEMAGAFPRLQVDEIMQSRSACLMCLYIYTHTCVGGSKPYLTRVHLGNCFFQHAQMVAPCGRTTASDAKPQPAASLVLCRVDDPCFLLSLQPWASIFFRTLGSEHLALLSAIKRHLRMDGTVLLHCALCLSTRRGSRCDFPPAHPDVDC